MYGRLIKRRPVQLANGPENLGRSVRWQCFAGCDRKVLPIAALAGRFMRGRQNQATLCLPGLEGLVATDREDLVATALRVAQDGAW